jgi:hypothetical protein
MILPDPMDREKAALPRHKEIDEHLARHILKVLA